MDRRNRARLLGGLLLILAGIWLLAAQFVPALRVWNSMEMTWPLIVVGVGVLLLVLGLVGGTPGMAVPACVVGGIGGLLYWQNATGHWESWAYCWTLIPGFVGVGTLLAGLLGERPRNWARGGITLILISLIAFVVFGAAFGNQFAGLGGIVDYWPALLILLGVVILVGMLFGRRGRG